MVLVAQNRKLRFAPVELHFHQTGISDLFARKNNKTLAETLMCKKYLHLAPEVHCRYQHVLEEKLGEFLYHLKQSGDTFYQRFLNKYGDKTYCEFSISGYLGSKGLYVFTLNGEVKYIGRSHDPFEKRINQGYGHLSPKNCYRDGQATNCHLNWLIAENHPQVAFHVCPLGDDAAIDKLEKVLIRQEQPAWNVALKRR